MKKVRFIFSIIICKLLILLGKLFGKKGSSAPGNIAMRIYPELLKNLSKQIESKIICTLGTNGKTTTNNMTDMLIKSLGKKTVCNNVGANMLYGIVTAFASGATIMGKLKAQYAVLEIDEASAKIVFRHLTPDYIILTNLFRDQIDRYGEIDLTIKQIKTAVDMAPNATLIINADDPLCKYIADSSQNSVVTYGISENILNNKNEAKDGKFCKFCGEELSYSYYHYSQLGDYKCEKCGFMRGKPDFEATDVDIKGNVSFTLNNEEKIESSTYGFYNIYNILASISAFKTAGLTHPDLSSVFKAYKPQTGRMQEFKFGDKTIILNLSKNPAGFNQSLEVLRKDERKKSVVIAVNDMESDGCDISWLYDVDFEILKDICQSYGVSGTRMYDMALRLFYADVCDSPVMNEDCVEIAMDFLKSDAEVIYLIVNYTVIFGAETRLKKKHKEFLKKGKENKN